jgi:hypothetical protein
MVSPQIAPQEKETSPDYPRIGTADQKALGPCLPLMQRADWFGATG